MDRMKVVNQNNNKRTTKLKNGYCGSRPLQRLQMFDIVPFGVPVCGCLGKMSRRLLDMRKPNWIEMKGWNETDGVPPNGPTFTLVGPVMYRLKGYRLWKNKYASLKEATLKVYKTQQQLKEDDLPDPSVNLATSNVKYCMETNRFIIKTTDKVEHNFKLKKKKHFDDWIELMSVQRRYRQYLRQTWKTINGGRSPAQSPSSNMLQSQPTTPPPSSSKGGRSPAQSPSSNMLQSQPTTPPPSSSKGGRSPAQSPSSNMSQSQPTTPPPASLKESTTFGVSKKETESPPDPEAELMVPNKSTQNRTSPMSSQNDYQIEESEEEEEDDDDEVKDGDEDEVEEVDDNDDTTASTTVEEQETQSNEENDSEVSNSSSVTSSKSSASSRSASSTESSTSSRSLKPVQKHKRKRIARGKLPAHMSPSQSVSFSTIKEASKGSLPVSLCEPLSFLQVMCEELEHRNFLDKAVKEKDAESRISNILAFALSFYANTKGRSRKPFNPKVGETFEMDRWADEGWRFHAEQVARKPDVSAGHAEGVNGWIWWQSISLKANFTLQGFSPVLIAESTGLTGVWLRKFNETYHWNKVNSQIENVLKEDKHLVHFGTLKLTCSSGYSAEVTLEKNQKGKYKGSIKDPNGKTICYVKGVWFGDCELTPKKKKTYAIFQPKPRPRESKSYYSLSDFAMQLNILHPNDDVELPSTDSRFRKDIRLLEEGKFGEANIMKGKMEKEIRDKRSRGESAKPMWFSKQAGSGVTSWTTKGNYWKCKDDHFQGIKINKIW